MQRTVKSTKFTYAVNELHENGEISTKLENIEIAEKDQKKALKQAFKKVGTFAPLKVETTEALYILDDEIFFKYAVKAETTVQEQQ